MSAGDNELDYLHVPRNPTDAAIMRLEELLRPDADPSPHRIHLAILDVLRELYRSKRERW